MKIIQIGFRETAASMHFLSHALNKLTKHRAVDVRFIGDYMATPTMIWANQFSREEVAKMIYKADVVHFHINVYPLFQSLQLDPKKFEDKKTLVYYHGTQLRTLGNQLTSENREVLPDHIVTVSTPDLLEHVDGDAVWLPVCRPFDELRQQFTMSEKDERAIKIFSKKRRITFAHATTSIDKVGSQIFMKAVTTLLRANGNVRFSAIINSTWSSAMSQIAGADVVLSDAKLGIIKLTAVEGAIFRKPIVSLLTPETRKIYEDLVGAVPPFVTWTSEKELVRNLEVLVERSDVREMLGEQIHDYLQPLHDEGPVVERYLGILDSFKK